MRVLIIALVVLLPVFLFGQVPDGIKYQAVARNTHGEPICNRAMFVKFSILEGSSSGSIIYQELHAAQSNEYGLINLSLGQGSTGGNFNSINWGNGQSKWIRIEMDTVGGNQFFIMGVTQLLSVPYAFYAETAGNSSSGESFWTESGNGIFYNSGKVGIGTNYPDNSAALEVNATSAGFLPPRMTTAQRDMISNPATGLMIYNLTTNCINVYKPGGWFEMCGDCIPPPQPSAQSNSPACEGDTVKLFAVNAGGGDCQWIGPNGFSSTTENPILTPAGLQHAGTYTLTTNNDCGSTNPVQVTVVVNPLPGAVGNITGTNSACAGSGPYNYSINPVANTIGYQWSIPSGATIINGDGTTNIQIQYAASAVSGNIVVTPYNSCGEGTPLPEFAVTILPLPNQADAGPDQLNVSGNTTTLQANSPANATGQWTIFSGSGGSISDASIPNTQFTGVTGTSYQLVWKISNSCGTSADTVAISFSAGFVCGGILTDVRDGQTYTTVQIGTQCWMAENMNYGSMVQGDVLSIYNGTVEKYCYLNLESNCETYGALYTWREALQLPDNCENESCQSIVGSNHQGVCPEGWHVPSDDEFKVLEMYLGMTQEEADMLNTWRGDPVGTMMMAGGSSGYEGLLGGRMAGANGFALLNSYEYPHTSTEYGASYAYRRCLRSGDSTVGRWNTFPKSWALSVRCVKNN